MRVWRESCVYSIPFCVVLLYDCSCTGWGTEDGARHKEKNHYMAVFINSQPQVNQSGNMASCFIGYSTKASSDEERAKADDKGYVKVSGKLIAFGENIDVLMALEKGAKVDIVTEPGAPKSYINRDGQKVEFIESVFAGFKGGATTAAAKAKPKAKANTKTAEDIFASEDEIPF